MKKFTYYLLTSLLVFCLQGHAQNGCDTFATAVTVNPVGQNFTGTLIANNTTGTNNDNVWFAYTPSANGTIDVNSCMVVQILI